jgi:putative membrane protein
MPYWHDGGTGFAYWWIFPLFFGSLWLLVIGVAIWLAVRWTRIAGKRRDGADPMATLQDRFARGEIDADEYQQRVKVLGGR